MSRDSAPGPETGIRAWVRLPATVVSSDREVDVVVPGSLPVAELLPDLAAEVGPPDLGATYSGYRLMSLERRVLDPALGLAAQGVGAGERLLLTRTVDVSPRVHDDLVEAMAEAVDGDRTAPPVAIGARAGLRSGGAPAVLGAWALSQAGSSGRVAAVAGVVAVLLLTGAAVLYRRPGDLEAATATARMALPYAAAAAVLALAPGTPASLATVAAGWGVLVSGTVAWLSLGGVSHDPPVGGRPVRRLVPPAVLVGGLLVGGGLTARAGGDWLTGAADGAYLVESSGPALLVVGLAAVGLLLLALTAVRD